MPLRYIVINYEKADSEDPKIVFRSKDSKEAEKHFTKSAERKTRSSVMYDTETDEVMKIAIEGDPIYLVKAIELARGELQSNMKGYLDKGAKKARNVTINIVIGELVKACAGQGIPGVGGYLTAHFTAPYYAVQGNQIAAGGACAGLWGGVTGAVVGTIVGGPVGGIVGGVAGGMGAGIATTELLKTFAPKDKCKVCQGCGMVEDYRRCKKCNGYGYLKGGATV
ncbi:hypothetical protein FSP39_006150 [Pinctada imbricata]|uniref:Uncharacterized protein n=1 Tax=Pinctada imbricata TaxID=66713 RepID=A0AA89BYU9_PINIB|nr:hypothetical protein FSP39_006150 [Pinctada imbricata]